METCPECSGGIATAIVDQVMASFTLPTDPNALEFVDLSCQFGLHVIPKKRGTWTVSALVCDKVCCGADDPDVPHSWTFEAVCCGPNIILEPARICPGETAIATVYPDHGRCVTWSYEIIEQEDLELEEERSPCDECEEPDNPQTYKLRAVKGRGKVRVIAKDCRFPDCEDSELLEIGCQSCSGGSGQCQAGKANAQLNGGVDVGFELGKNAEGESVGTLRILASAPHSNLGNPHGLYAQRNHPSASSELEVLTHDGMLRQLLSTDKVLADIAYDAQTAPYEYTISFYTEPQGGWQVGQDGLYVTNGLTPYVYYEVEAISAPTDFNTLRIRELAQQLLREFTYTYSSSQPGAWSWSLATGDGAAIAREETESWTDEGGGEWTRVVTVEQDGGVVSQTTETLKEYTWGMSGAAFSTGYTLGNGYNDRNELTSATRDAAEPPTWTYTYDPIGNRTAATAADAGTETTYTANALNQYLRAMSVVGGKNVAQGFRHDADGNLAEEYVAADMNCDEHLDFFDIDPFVLAVMDPTEWQAQFPGCNILNGDLNGDGLVNFFDIDGFVAAVTIGGGGLHREYRWDAENRLTAVVPLAPVPGSQRVEYTYDYLGRRAERRVHDWDPDANGGAGAWETTPSEKMRYIWDGWLQLAELDALNLDAQSRPKLLKTYTWGLDLSGSREGAAGIGGLLAVADNRGTTSTTDDVAAAYCYDANGNVTHLIDWRQTAVTPNGDEWGAARLVAAYEYDSYGNVVAESGGYAAANRWRFSTREFDVHGHWPVRALNPPLGRWAK